MEHKKANSYQYMEHKKANSYQSGNGSGSAGVSSRPAAQMNAEQMLKADRRYWGIETGLHLRLDVIAGEDRSRVRNRNPVMYLAVIEGRWSVWPCTGSATAGTGAGPSRH